MPSITKGPVLTWRVVDIVVAAVLGVVIGLIFFLWNQLYTPVSAPLEAALPGLQALTYGVWLIGGVLGGLIIRKPGAALFVELIAASVSALLGAQWAFLTLGSGLVQGLGAELIFLLVMYRKWNLPLAMLAGALSGLGMALFDLIVWYPGAGGPFTATYAISAVVSGTVLAGLVSWFLMKALARTGVLNRFASGRTAVRTS